MRLQIPEYIRPSFADFVTDALEGKDVISFIEVVGPRHMEVGVLTNYPRGRRVEPAVETVYHFDGNEVIQIR